MLTKLIKKTFKIARNYFLFIFIIQDYITFKNACSQQSSSMSLRTIFPQIRDKTKTTGFDRHYVYHTAWASRVLQETKPISHTDISSSLYFAALNSAWLPIHFYDYRPADIKLNNLISGSADLHNLPFKDKSIMSLSCMHTIEHIGLGRYGEPINPEGDKIAINELKRVLAPKGNLLIVVPVGIPLIAFNAHRIYSYSDVINLCIDTEFYLHEFALIQEKTGPLIRNADPDLVKKESYACGCFWFKRRNK